MHMLWMQIDLKIIKCIWSMFERRDPIDTVLDKFCVPFCVRKNSCVLSLWIPTEGVVLLAAVIQLGDAATELPFSNLHGRPNQK